MSKRSGVTYANDGHGVNHITFNDGRRRGNPPPPGGPGQPGHRGGSGVPRQRPRNTFNITSSTIGTLSVGNRGTTILNQRNETYNDGAKNVEFDIKGGNFNQANLGKEAKYDNKQSNIMSKGASGSSEGENGVVNGGSENRTIDQDLESDMVAETQLVELLKKNVSLSDIKKLLKKKFTIKEIHQAIKTQTNDAAVQRMITSMLSMNRQ